MSTINFACPHCDQAISSDDPSVQGTEAACPTCEQPFIIPIAVKPPEARLISATPPTQSDQESEERDIFEIIPQANAFLVEIMFGALFSLVLIGFFILLNTWIKIKCTRYRLTTERFIVRRGLWAKRVDEVELYRITDVAVNQSLVQRLLGFGSITVLSNDDSTPVILMEGIAKPTEIKEIMRKAYRESRRREGVRATEWVKA